MSKGQKSDLYRICERKKIVVTIANYVHRVTEKFGEVIDENQGKFNTQKTREFRIGKFKFVSHQEQTMMGGFSATVFFDERKVFELYHQIPDINPADCQVSAYDTEVDWVTPLRWVMRDPRRGVFSIEDEIIERRRLRELRLAAKQARIVAELNRLKLK